jgi:hypothetical protein
MVFRGSSAPAGPVTNVIVLGLGESGMVGQGGTDLDAAATLPVGYPPVSGVLALNNAWNYDDPIVEPIESQGVGTPVFSGMVGEVVVKWGWGGVFCWKLQQALGSSYEVTYLPVARGGSVRTFYMAGYTSVTSSSNVGFAAAVHWVREAQKQSNSVLGAILLDQGINDYLNFSEAGWSADWQTTISNLRTQLDGTTAPVLCAKQFASKPAAGNIANWTNLLAEQTAFASAVVPKRIVTQKQNGPWTNADGLHARQSVNNQLADDTLAASLTDIQTAVALGRPVPPDAGSLVGWTDFEKALAADSIVLTTKTKMVDAAGGFDLSASGGAIYFLVTVNSQSAGAASTLLGRGTTGAPGSGVLMQFTTNQTVLRMRVVDGGSVVRTKDYTVVAGDVGDVMAVVAWHDGSQIGLRVNKVAVGSPTACVGFSAALASVPASVGSLSIAGDISMWGAGSCLFVPSTANMDAWADACKAANRCVAMPGGTNAHLYNFNVAGDVVIDETGTDNLIANKTGKTRLVNGAPVWGF